MAAGWRAIEMRAVRCVATAATPINGTATAATAPSCGPACTIVADSGAATPAAALQAPLPSHTGGDRGSLR